MGKRTNAHSNSKWPIFHCFTCQHFSFVFFFFFYLLNVIIFWSLWGESKNGGREERQELGERSSFPRETHKRQKISNMYKNIRKETQLKGIDLLSCVCYRGHIYLIWPRLFFFSHLSIKKKTISSSSNCFFFFFFFVVQWKNIFCQ